MNTLTDEQIINTFDEHFGGDDLDVPDAEIIAFARALLTQTADKDAIPELRNMRNANTHGDFDVLVRFASCRSAGAFCLALRAAIAQQADQSGKEA